MPSPTESSTDQKMVLLTHCHICGGNNNLSLVTGRCWPCIDKDVQDQGENDD